MSEVEGLRSRLLQDIKKILEKLSKLTKDYRTYCSLCKEYTGKLDSSFLVAFTKNLVNLDRELMSSVASRCPEAESFLTKTFTVLLKQCYEVGKKAMEPKINTDTLIQLENKINEIRTLSSDLLNIVQNGTIVLSASPRNGNTNSGNLTSEDSMTWMSLASPKTILGQNGNHIRRHSPSSLKQSNSQSSTPENESGVLNSSQFSSQPDLNEWYPSPSPTSSPRDYMKPYVSSKRRSLPSSSISRLIELSSAGKLENESNPDPKSKSDTSDRKPTPTKSGTSKISPAKIPTLNLTQSPSDEVVEVIPLDGSVVLSDRPKTDRPKSARSRKSLKSRSREITNEVVSNNITSDASLRSQKTIKKVKSSKVKDTVTLPKGATIQLPSTLSDQSIPASPEQPHPLPIFSKTNIAYNTNNTTTNEKEEETKKRRSLSLTKQKKTVKPAAIHIDIPTSNSATNQNSQTGSDSDELETSKTDRTETKSRSLRRALTQRSKSAKKYEVRKVDASTNSTPNSITTTASTTSSASSNTTSAAATIGANTNSSTQNTTSFASTARSKNLNRSKSTTGFAVDQTKEANNKMEKLTESSPSSSNNKKSKTSSTIFKKSSHQDKRAPFASMTTAPPTAQTTTFAPIQSTSIWSELLKRKAKDDLQPSAVPSSMVEFIRNTVVFSQPSSEQNHHHNHSHHHHHGVNHNNSNNIPAHLVSHTMPLDINIAKHCIAHLKNYLHVEGLFRVSGETSAINSIYSLFKDPQKLNLIDRDPHDVAGAFKQWLRSLDHPLIPYKYVKQITQSILDPNLVQDIKVLIEMLPNDNRELMKELFQFLCLVQSNSSVNKMDTHNLGIVFGPNLLREDNESETNPETAMLIHRAGVKLVEIMMKNYAHIFQKSPDG
eukprot:TRINITY_DN8802_c0_g1_i1.p1 TRINITY_DN8802_c0_g1~~TRINITY_DN8802_c0_g1_i1.p1  ORF type:complete len:888 (+),score=205.04 TRINITY_DN8802_c0_g1_i1:53-2716(+)